jgi:hypothetical protein
MGSRRAVLNQQSRREMSNAFKVDHKYSKESLIALKPNVKSRITRVHYETHTTRVCFTNRHLPKKSMI